MGSLEMTKKVALGDTTAADGTALGKPLQAHGDDYVLSGSVSIRLTRASSSPKNR